MPFDGLPTETKPDVFSLDGLIAWLEQQPGETTYNFNDCCGLCLLSQYVTARLGRYSSGDDYCRMADVGGFNVIQRLAGEEPWTFCAALQRARALRGDQ